MNFPSDRRRSLARAAAFVWLTTLLAGSLHAAEPVGIWKLVVLAFGEEDFAIVELHKDGGQAKAVLLDGRKNMLDAAKPGDVMLSDGRVSFTLQGPQLALSFLGDLAKDGPDAGQVLGSIRAQNNVFPAKLVKTREEKLPPARLTPALQELSKVRNETDPKAKVQALRAFNAKHVGEPICHVAYTDILAIAEAAGLPTAEVDALVATWRAEARPYGPTWVAEVTAKAFLALAPQKPYAATAVNLGREVVNSLPAEVPSEARILFDRQLAMAAKNAGDAPLAAEAEGRADALEAKLDEEYLAKVPPFKPTPYPGRKKPGAARTVVLELFTGAQCPPCVAADVAFDALLKTYKPDEFIGLQYHLHIPKPDPLTNPDSIARQEYYIDHFSGTPSVFFNGKADRSGGGLMEDSQRKYNTYRAIVDRALETPQAVEVSVSATRAGDVISIAAEAVTPAAKAGTAKKSLTKAESSVKLRLALTEESVRYVGSNKLRFHHHVVRAMPGGAKGTAFVDGRGKIEVKVDLADLRRRLEEYLSEAASERPFSGPLPPIDFKNLGVVAFVQDDLDKAIIAAASAPVADAAP